MSSVFLPPEYTRLVTIVAHVDHGKTSLADNLIEHNGIISERLAGTLRYLDSDPEEQRRGITMRSSAIGLQHQFQAKGKDAKLQKHIIHLLDSPGHSDFSMEVSSALMACDSCLLVVDAVEGMAPRTHQVLREAHLHRLVPILVINKIDRLYTDLALSTTEAYLRLRSLLEILNAAASSMLTSAAQDTGGNDDEYEKYWHFDTAAGNVIFASALFGWGFTVQSLSRALFKSKILSLRPVFLKQCLFSDARIKGEKVLKWKTTDESPPLFAEYALQPLWDIYEAVATASSIVSNDRLQVDSPGLEPILPALQIGTTGNECPTTVEEFTQLLKSTGAVKADQMLRALLRRFRPLAPTILDVVCELTPSPKEAVTSIRQSIFSMNFNQTPSANSVELQRNIYACNREGCTMAHVCKFVSTDIQHIQDPNLYVPDGHGTSILLGLARVLCGTLKTGCSYHVVGPKHKSGEVAKKQRIRLYLLMGSSFVPVNEVSPGHLCAVHNLDDIALKTMSLSSEPYAVHLKGFPGRRPLVKVNVEPIHAGDTECLERGLVKLSLADAAVEVTATARGERLLSCLGEIHLEQSIHDLESLYCGKDGIKLKVSDPIVDFGETTTWFPNEMHYETFFDSLSDPLRQETIPPYNEEKGLSHAKRGRSRCLLSGKVAALSLRVVPLHTSVQKGLIEGRVEDKAALVVLGEALGILRKESATNTCYANDVLSQLKSNLCVSDENGNALIESVGMINGGAVKGTLSTDGQVYPGVGSDEDIDRLRVVKGTYEKLREDMKTQRNSEYNVPIDIAAKNLWTERLKGSTVAGFQIACRSGWICEEPVRNVLVIIEGLEIAMISTSDGSYVPARDLTGGMAVSALKTGIRTCLLTRPARLVEGHLRLTLHSSIAGIGSLHAVLNKRRGKVIDDTMVDGTDLLLITAFIPQAESFGLAPELLKKTSGEVTAPELVFSHWAPLDVDPFWIPTTVEEREDFGELQQAGDTSTGVDNTALKYIRNVRQRKGLIVDSNRTILAAEKQRTLKR